MESITEDQSLKDINQSIKRFDNNGVCKIFVGNKCDMEESRKISFEEDMEIPFLEASTKKSVNME